MSHFSVLVISGEKPTDDVLARILQPWHEYECTGIDDQYVVDVDITNEVREQFAKPQKVLVLADGTVHSRRDQKFYTKKAVPKDIFSRDKFEMPDGARAEKMTADEARKHGVGYASMAECAKDYFGVESERDGKFFRRTNPNKKWDWWQVGGRWSGMFKPHYEPSNDPANKETCWLCHGTGKRPDMQISNGCNGCGGSGVAEKWPTKWRDVGNVVQVKDLPLLTLRDIAERKAVEEHDKGHAIIAGREIPAFDESLPNDKAREAFYGSAVVADLKAAGFDSWGIFDLMDRLRLSRGEAARLARAGAISTFAVVKDGNWYERGKMGWFGMTTGEKEREVWLTEFGNLLDGLSPETWLAVVDCHI